MRIAKLAFAALIVLGLTAFTAAQSVADAARQQQKPAKKAAKVYTNDEIPSVDTSRDSTPAKDAAPAKSESTTPPANDAKADDKPADAKTADKKDASPEDAKKLEDEWKSKISTQKQKIADVEREIQLTDREYKLRSAVFFADAGNRLRDDRKWADAERKYKDDMARLQQDLTANKTKLEDLREEARKAGIKAE